MDLSWHMFYTYFLTRSPIKQLQKLPSKIGPSGGRRDGPHHGLHQGARQNIIVFYNQCGTCFIPIFNEESKKQQFEKAPI